MAQVGDAIGMRSEGAYGDPFSKWGMMMQKLRSEWAIRLPECSEVVVDRSSGELSCPSIEMGDLDCFVNWSELGWVMEGAGAGGFIQ